MLGRLSQVHSNNCNLINWYNPSIKKYPWESSEVNNRRNDVFKTQLLRAKMLTKESGDDKDLTTSFRKFNPNYDYLFDIEICPFFKKIVGLLWTMFIVVLKVHIYHLVDHEAHYSFVILYSTMRIWLFTDLPLELLLRVMFEILNLSDR